MGLPAATTIVPALTEQEQQLVYNIEVLGLTVKRAAEILGVPNVAAVMQRPEVQDAREKLRAEVRRHAEITKEDVIHGIKRAIDQATTLADPTAQIIGWREIAKMLGYDAPREVKITISHETATLRKQVSQLDDAELVELLGADNVIDGDFYEVHPDGSA